MAYQMRITPDTDRWLRAYQKVSRLKFNAIIAKAVEKLCQSEGVRIDTDAKVASSSDRKSGRKSVASKAA
jgi:hypothetical protein